MNTIKEQATVNVTAKDAESYEIGFEAGANYVLSVLYDVAYKEDWIANPKDGIRRFFEVYRQLKK